MKRPSNEQIDLWYPRLFRTALRMTGCAEIAAEMTQQAFCNALNKWELFEGKVLATTWIHQILVNCVRDWARRKSRHENCMLNEWELATEADPGNHPPKHLERQEELAHLRSAISNLPKMVRPAFVATVLDGYTYQEASEMLAVPVGTIGSRVYQARQELNTAMRKRFPEDKS